MKQKHIDIILFSTMFVFSVWLTNFTAVGYFLKRNYSYSNYDGSFRYNEYKLKGRGYNSRDKGYSIFLEKHPDIKDKQLYRTFRLDPWRFWEWHEWYYHFDRFKLPYISENKIKRNKEKEEIRR